jgi:hypothetical protein
MCVMVVIVPVVCCGRSIFFRNELVVVEVMALLCV